MRVNNSGQVSAQPFHYPPAYGTKIPISGSVVNPHLLKLASDGSGFAGLNLEDLHTVAVELHPVEGEDAQYAVAVLVKVMDYVPACLHGNTRAVPARLHDRVQLNIGWRVTGVFSP